MTLKPVFIKNTDSLPSEEKAQSRDQFLPADQSAHSNRAPPIPLPSLIGSMLARYSAHCGAVGHSRASKESGV